MKTILSWFFDKSIIFLWIILGIIALYRKDYPLAAFTLIMAQFSIINDKLAALEKK